MADQTGHPVPTTPPLVGRERELAALRAALAAALTGHGGLVLVGGEAGVGKTTLAEALLTEATEQGALVLVGRCYDLSETPPYGPWAEALAHFRAAPDLPPALRALPQPNAAASAGPAALFRQVQDFLAAVAASQPLVLLLDDLHWADPASLDLLRFLARQLAATPLLLLATYRADELTRRHPLYALLPLLEREARATRLDLRALGADALRTLVDGRYALPAPDAARLVAWLADRAEGNAFFTAQLLRALEEADVLAEARARWSLGDLGAVGLPAPLRQVLDARLARLGEEAQRLLALAAVIGQEVPLALWAAMAEADEDGLVDTIERAAEARLLVALPDGTAVRFAHALIREALYEGILPVRRRRMHRLAGEALAATAHPDPDPVAYHLQRAGDERAAEWLIHAGERAQRAYAWLSAAERYEAALALMEQTDTNAHQRMLVLLTLAQLRRYTDVGAALASLEAAMELATATGDPALVAAAQFDRGHLRQIAGDALGGIADMEAALPILEALPPADLARLPTLQVLGVSPEEPYHRGVLMQAFSMVGRHAEVLALGATLARRGPRATARGLAGLAAAYATRGRAQEAYQAVRDGIARNRAAGQHQEAAQFLRNLVYMFMQFDADQLAERAHLVAEAEAAWERGSGVDGSVPARNVQLPLLWVEGAWGEARDLADGMHALERGQAQTRLIASLTLARLAHAQGNAALTRSLVHEWLPDGPTTKLSGIGLWPGAMLQRLGAALALDAGDLSLARSWLDAHDRLLDQTESVLGRAEGQIERAAYHRAAGNPAQAREHAERALAHASAPRQPLALLAAHRLLGEMDTAASQHAEAATHLAAALALAEACAAPYERALTLLALAALHLATGDRDAARATLDEARALLLPLDARPALARADTLAARLAPDAAASPAPPASGYLAGLSAREVEVLRLVATGLTNAQAAARLFLSPRTVDQHLRSIYNKLGVSSRAAASAFAAEHGLR